MDPGKRKTSKIGVQPDEHNTKRKIDHLSKTTLMNDAHQYIRAHSGILYHVVARRTTQMRFHLMDEDDHPLSQLIQLQLSYTCVHDLTGNTGVIRCAREE